MTGPVFRTGARNLRERADATRSFEQAFLPDAQKEMLCRSLLAEFGVTSVRESGDGELIHSCCLPTGGHKNGDLQASASLNYKKLTYNCFGCGSSGGLLWFIGLCRGEDSDAARAWLDDQTGSGPDEQSLSSLLEFFDAVYAQESRRTAPIPKMARSVLEPWRLIHPYLTDPIEEGGRGISEESVVRYQVGYAAEFPIWIKAPEGHPDADDRGRLLVISPRIVIPHFWKGDLVGWQTRRLIDDGTPKYQSSPDFPKDTTIFDYDPKRPTAVVVESPMSRLACADDVPNMEATFGAKTTDRQCSLLTIHRRLVLWMDNDDAGWKATKRIAEYAEPYSDVWVVDSPWDQDSGDLPTEERLRLLADPVPYALWHPPSVVRCWRCKQPKHGGRC